MHEQWQELISFYVAGTLPPDQARAVEQHLATCESCRQAAAEWQVIAQAVRAEASSWAQQLPPLSASVRAGVSQRRAPSEPAVVPFAAPPPARQQREPRVNRRAWVPLTALAAALMVLLFGALLVFMSGRGSDEAEPTQVAMLSIITVTSEQRPPTTTKQAARPTQGSDLGILPAVATQTPLPPLTEAPAASPAASSTQVPPPGPTVDIADSDRTMLPETCSVSPVSGSVSVYRTPDLTSPVTGTITANPSLWTNIRSENGWYQIIEIGTGILGWAPGSSLALSGPCADLPLPTATQNNTTCVGFIGSDNTGVRGGPGESYDLIDAVALGNRVEVIARSDNGWYRIHHEVAPAVFTGWVPSTSLTISGQCGELPLVSSAAYDPQFPETATPTATYIPTSEPGRITGFTTSVSTAARGSSFTVNWTTTNTSQVWVEYYGIDTQTGQSSSSALGSVPGALASGQWTVTVPPDFAYTGMRFVIIVDNYDNGLGIPRAELVVTIQD